MLKVKTKLDKSRIAGIGLFADQFIPKDTILWEYNPEHDKEYTQDEYDAVQGLDKEFLHTYCFKFAGKYILCVDNSRFFNHSNTPNCYSADFNENSFGYTKTLRDIEVGEELTDNYAGFGLNEDDEGFNTQI